MPAELICVDAGIVIRRVVFPDETDVQQLWEEWEKSRVHLIAPYLLFYEVTNVLYRYQYQKWLSPLTVQIALAAALALPVELFSEPTIHLRARELAEHYRLSAAYDTHYLALAERQGAKLYTTDRRLLNGLGNQIPSWIHLVGKENT